MAKYTCYFKPKLYCNIYQNLAKQFTLHSVEAYSELFQTCKPGGYLFGKKSFKKKKFEGGGNFRGGILWPCILFLKYSS